MKKRIVMLLVVALMLCGCSAEPNLPQSGEAPAQEQREMPMLYEKGGVAEAGTDGALRAYGSAQAGYAAVLPFGQQVLALDTQGNVTLLEAEEGYVMAQVETGLPSAWSMADLRVKNGSLGCYNSSRLEVMVLDEQLKTTAKVPLPEDIQGRPLILMARGEILYCTDGQIRAMDIHSGISRMVRSHRVVSQELLGSYFDDTVFSCLVVDAQGNQRVLFLDADTGEELYETTQPQQLQSCGEDYYACLPEAGGVMHVFGQRDQQAYRLDAGEGEVLPLLENNAALGWDAVSGGVRLSAYDLKSGKRTAQVVVPGLTGVTSAAGDGRGIWLISDNALYRWDLEASSVKEEAVYTHRIYTRDAPDTQGLEACAQRAQTLSRDYGFTLDLWEDAAFAGRNQGAQAEYRTDALNTAMDTVEKILSRLPADFLSITGDFQVHLVQSLSQEQTGALYWESGACHVLLTGVNVEEDLLRAMGVAVDTRVLGNSFDYDNWDDLNPWWFDYTYDYEENLQRNDPENCLEGDNRYFTDAVAMSYPTEDRSRIFACAMAEGNEELFTPKPIQKKLRSVCVAIREAYGWEDSDENFAWERYLKTPLGAAE